MILMTTIFHILLYLFYYIVVSHSSLTYNTNAIRKNYDEQTLTTSFPISMHFIFQFRRFFADLTYVNRRCSILCSFMKCKFRCDQTYWLSFDVLKLSATCCLYFCFLLSSCVSSIVDVSIFFFHLLFCVASMVNGNICWNKFRWILK